MKRQGKVGFERGFKCLEGSNLERETVPGSEDPVAAAS